MKTFWHQAAVFGGVIAVVGIMVLVMLFANGLGSEWVAHPLGNEADRSIVGADIAKLQQAIAECEKNPATQQEIDKYTSANEWQGFVFANTKTGTIYAFSQNLGIMAVYQEQDTHSVVESTSLSTANSVQTQPETPAVDYTRFSFYRCPSNAMQLVEEIYLKYYE